MAARWLEDTCTVAIGRGFYLMYRRQAQGAVRRIHLQC